MVEITILFVAGFALGLIPGILVGWRAAPAEVWPEPKQPPESTPMARAVGISDLF
jgi:hypothetical protein